MTTQAQVDALRANAARGVLELRTPDGSTVKYASPSEMLRIAADLETRIGTVDFQRTTLTSFARD